MKSDCIDYKETGSFSPALISYLEGDEKLEPFCSFPPTIKGFRDILTSKKQGTNREILVHVLREQYASLTDPEWSVSEKVNLNIASLASENTCTITTGHQLNIFTGPLYFIYKIVTAIKLASELKEEFPDKNFVPVYWMATEDHDFAEINHTSVSGEFLSWNEEVSGATGRLSPEGIKHIIQQFTGILGISENAGQLASLVQKAYLEHSTLADATRFLANGLFAQYGLVCIDADDPRLKQQFAPIIEQDIFGQNSFREINNTSNQLQKLGFQTQVNAREINFFYLKNSLRERIVPENGIFKILNSDIQFSNEQMLEEIRQFPDRFSPNVIMRPLYQECILPNLAYIGGGAEIVYWLQLKANFDFYGISFPILVPRNSALIADELIVQKLNRLNLQIKDLFTSPVELQKKWIRTHSEHELSITTERKELQVIFEKLKIRAAKIDQTLAPSTEAVHARLQKALDNLEKKLIKADKKNHVTALAQISNIRETLFPKGSLQERSENFAPFYVKYGGEFISELLRHFEPLEFKFTILY